MGGGRRGRPSAAAGLVPGGVGAGIALGAQQHHARGIFRGDERPVLCLFCGLLQWVLVSAWGEGLGGIPLVLEDGKRYMSYDSMRGLSISGGRKNGINIQYFRYVETGRLLLSINTVVETRT